MPGYAPDLTNRSLWQTPQASTLTRTQPGPGVGISRSSSSNGPLALVTTAAFMVGMGRKMHASRRRVQARITDLVARCARALSVQDHPPDDPADLEGAWRRDRLTTLGSGLSSVMGAACSARR